MFFVGFRHSSGLTIHTNCLRMILWLFMGPILTTFIIYVLYFYVFLCFEAVYYLVFYALKINMAKLELVTKGDADNVVGLASIMGCGVSSCL